MAVFMNLQKYEILKESLYKLIPNIDSIFENAHKHGAVISLENFLLALSNDTYCLYKELNVGEVTVSRLLKKLFPERKSSIKACTYILSTNNYKWCSGCKLVLPFEDFHKNKTRPLGLASTCKICSTKDRNNYQKEYQKRRKALKLDRLPRWADLNKIKEIYKNCPVGYHVDHIIPLKGKLVSGLHIAENLQYLTAQENQSKNNSYTIE